MYAIYCITPYTPPGHINFVEFPGIKTENAKLTLRDMLFKPLTDKLSNSSNR